MEEKYKIHAFYILAILTSIIIILISVEWSTIPGLRDYISFALTVFSLGLAVIAIIYSMYSNTSLSSSLSLLEGSSIKLSNTSDSLSSSTEELAMSINKIPLAIEKVESRVSATHDIVKNLELSTAPPEAKGKISTEFTHETIDRFVDNMSYNGLITIYILNFSYRNKVPVYFDKKTLELVNIRSDYNFACYVVLKAIGLIKAKQLDSSMHLVTGFHPYLNEIIDNAINQKIDELYPLGVEEDDDYLEFKSETLKELSNLKKHLEAQYLSKDV
ncbi:hypothetical protein BBL88_16175 [Vibrio parahaemolyticus]|uniref:hypothetical protein n=1 Tax=Vibrio parahaemolyticus TaxID=670 RepID=UPI00084A38C7|nr:hypothetical protein [Vibrio parahaemolyticus]ODW53216.1 hypothetical protein BBL88_16175 [Vibrio parahaemolyticus]